MAGENIIGFILKATDKTKQGLASASGSIRQFTKRIRNQSGGLGGFMSKALTGGVRMFGGALRSVARTGRRVFKGLLVGIGGVATGLVLAMKRAQEFNKQIAQVATLTGININDAKKQVRGLAAEFGLAKEELTKGLYDAISAGIPKENAFEFLRTASKTAIAGATDTASAVDLLTTTINAFGLKASDAGKVADTLFASVRLGKTTIEELSGAMFQAAPLAAATGVSMEEVVAAAASLTKQGTPTRVAMTQIRSAIIGMNRTMGDGWASTMTLQEGMVKMAEKAKGSSTALQRMTGQIEGAMAITSLTGDKAASAADDLLQIKNAAGQMGNALAKVENDISLDKLFASIDNVVRVAGSAALKLLGPTIELAATKIAEFADSLAKIEENPKLKAIRDQIAGITDALFAGGEESKQAWEDIGTLLKASAMDAGSAFVNVVGPKLLKYAREAGNILFRSEEVKNAAGQLGAGAAVVMGGSAMATLGAKGGAAIGTMVLPGVGTAVGAGVGALGGLATAGLVGYYGGRGVAKSLGGADSGTLTNAPEDNLSKAADQVLARRQAQGAGLSDKGHTITQTDDGRQAILRARFRREDPEGYARWVANTERDSAAEGGDPVATGTRAPMRGGRSSYGFLEHASAMGTEVRKWQGDDIAKQQLEVQKRIADGVEDLKGTNEAI